MTTSKVVISDGDKVYKRWELPIVVGTNKASVKELETIQQQAYNEGFASGQNAINQNIQSLKSILELLSEPLKNLDDEVVEQLSSLAMIVAKQVIRRELHTEAGEIVGIVREAITALPLSARKVILNIHPDDAELVRSAFSLGEGETETDDPLWKIVEDPMLTRGGCKISSENSFIDATVEGRLNRVINTLLGGEREADE